MKDIHWHNSWYLLTAQRFFHIHDNLIASVLLCVDPIIWSFILNPSLYKDHVVLQFQFCPLWQRAAPVYSHSAGRDSPRQPTIFLQFHIFSGSSHICLYKFLFVNIEMFFYESSRRKISVNFLWIMAHLEHQHRNSIFCLLLVDENQFPLHPCLVPPEEHLFRRRRKILKWKMRCTWVMKMESTLSDPGLAVIFT